MGSPGEEAGKVAKSVRSQIRDSLLSQLKEKLETQELPKELEHQVKTYLGFYDRFGELEEETATIPVGTKLYIECSKELRQVAREMRSILDFLGCKPPDSGHGTGGGYIEL